MTSELKSCPFCSFRAGTMPQTDVIRGRAYTNHVVRCMNNACCAQVMADTIGNARDIWNRRAPEPAGRDDGGWIDVRTDTPPEDVPVWCLTKGDGIFIGGYVYIDEGWVWTNCYTSIYHTLKDGAWKWEANDFEYDDEYEVIAWQHLPSPPNANLLRRLSLREG